MNVVGHDTPCKQFVSQAVKMQKIFFSNFSDARISQQTIAQAAIKICFEFCAPFADAFNLQQVPPFNASRCGHGILQSKGNELNEIREIAVWKVTAYVPAEEAE